MSQWFFHYGWGILLGASIALGSLLNLRRRVRGRYPWRHRAMDIVGLVLGTAITLLVLLAWAMGWK